MTSTGVRTLSRALVALLAGGLLAGGLTALPAHATHGDLPPGRRLTPYTVKPGETAPGLAVRHHAWTAELIRYNHLGSTGRLYAGQRIVIPVVIDRVPEAAPKANAAPKPKKSKAPKATKKTWQHADPSQAKVRRVITRTAIAHGVDPELALAVSWQESGWQMHHVSYADAIGAMQVLPGTGTWMSLYARRPLDLTKLSDNALAGVLLLKVLRQNTRGPRHQVAAYYQGLGAVQRNGLYRETVPYVANVLAIKHRLESGWRPER